MREKLPPSRAESFRTEHPVHASRIDQVVHTWLPLVTDQYTEAGGEILNESTRNFVLNAIHHPDEVILQSTPLSHATSGKRTAFIERLGRVKPYTFVSQFGLWFKDLTEKNDPTFYKKIEDTAANHIYTWIAKLPLPYQRDIAVWDEVDRNLQAFKGKKVDTLHPASVNLLSCIQAAITEQFINDTYAPSDLFGPVQ